MYSKTDIKPHPLFKSVSKNDLFGGQGIVQVWDLQAQREAGPFKASLWCRLEANGIVGPHIQENYDELILCISGSGNATINHECFALAPGIQVFLKRGKVLEIKAESTQPLIYLIIKVEARL